ncbi:AAA family ATPase [Sphingomonas sp. AX6]|uniref:AAA family ATPase n=1 Tax=Sphingomonas sp. AX6 TaxID=2653171 RepID=UPI001F46045D|nr:AAA family ATPase [Sphingomonas sp. AX6]
MDQRIWRGVPLTKKAKDGRFRRMQRVERGLPGLGFFQQTLEALFDAGQWEDLLLRLKALRENPGADSAAARAVVPEAKDPASQLGNLVAATLQYGYFLDGRDPNYGSSDDLPESDDALGLTKDAVEAVMQEYDKGASGFARKYGFATNFDYVVCRPGQAQQYPAKAVFLVAYSSIPGNPDIAAKGQRDTFRDAEGGPIHTELRRLGYLIENRRNAGKEIVANRIREYVLAHYIEPAKSRGDATVTIRAGDVHKELGLSAQLPNVCQAIEGEKLREVAGLDKPEVVSGPASGRGSNVVYRFVINSDSLNDEQVLKRFEGNPDFRSRRSEWTGYQRAAFCKMARAVHAAGLDWYHTDIPQIRFGRKSSLLSRAEGTLGSLQFRASGPFLTFSHQSENLGLAGNYAFVEQQADQFEAAIAGAIEAIKDWQPNSSHRLGKWPDEYGRGDTAHSGNDAMTMPTNLILYGPPGTGKTYNTALEAVSLCDGNADYPPTREGRLDLMKRYNELVVEKRIGFVTFHQNYDYETFVEGLRPETGEGESSSAGFRLEARAGIFREICALADQARTRISPSATSPGYDFTGRRFWKMGQGAIGTEDDVYEAAVANSYITLGWGGTIDWSPTQFSTFDAIKAEWLKQNPDDTTPSNWTQTWPFRSEMKVGDIVIVPYGNTAFRAIAEVTGDYRFEPSAEGYYAHRRDVRWLLTLDEPLPLDTILDGNFTMRTLYPLQARRVNLPALGRLIAGKSSGSEGPAKGPTDQFVLIIDEINRANISKVFGELITLIEPDKRLGMPNELTLTLPYSKKRDFGVPANLHIIGTMNTADRSIALLDTALRRRFKFREMAPDSGLLEEATHRTGIDLVRALDTINRRIEYLIDREHRIGHAFFIGCETDEEVHAAMRDKVIPLLQEYFFEDWSRIHAVLGAGFIREDKLDPPPGIDGDQLSSWSVRKPFADNAYDRLTGKVAPDVEVAGA